MKPFVVINCYAGIFINRTENRTFSKHLIAGQFDTYEEAKTFKESLETAAENQRGDFFGKLQDYQDAIDRGDWRKVNRIARQVGDDNRY